MKSTLGRSILNSLSIKQREEITKYFEELYGLTPKESNTVSAEEVEKQLLIIYTDWMYEGRNDNDVEVQYYLDNRCSEEKKEAEKLLKEYKENNNCIIVEGKSEQLPDTCQDWARKDGEKCIFTGMCQKCK